MPNLITPPELAEEIANEIGRYGTHREEDENCPCRICYVADLTERIRQATINEHMLHTQGRFATGREDVGIEGAGREWTAMNWLRKWAQRIDGNGNAYLSPKEVEGLRACVAGMDAKVGPDGRKCWVMWNTETNEPWDPPNPPMIWLSTPPPPLNHPFVWVRMVEEGTGSGSPPRALRAEIREALATSEKAMLYAFDKDCGRINCRARTMQANQHFCALHATLFASIEKARAALEASEAKPAEASDAEQSPCSQCGRNRLAMAPGGNWWCIYCTGKAVNAPQSPSSIQVQGATDQPTVNQPSSNGQGATGSPARPMKLRTIYTESHGNFDSVLIDSYPIGGGVWQGPREIAKEINFRIKSFEVPAPESPAEGRAGV